MNKKFLQGLMLLTALLAWTGCIETDDLAESSRPTIDEAMPYIHTMIRFENADGDNLMASADDVRQNVGYDPFKLEDIPWLDVRCERGSDGATMTFSEVGWYCPGSKEVETGLYGQGPLLKLTWIDFDVLASQNITLPYQEKYTLHIRNDRVWEGEEHTIEWGIVFHDRYSYTVTACSVDGDSAVHRFEGAKDQGLFIGLVHLRAATR